MDKDNRDNIIKIKNTLIRKIQYLAILLLFLEISILFITDFVIPHYPMFAATVKSNIYINNTIDTIKSLTIEILPITAIAIFIHPVIQQFNKLENIIEDDEQKEFLSNELRPIRQEMNNISSAINSINKYKEIYGINYSYNETDWKVLLSNASHVVLCMLYTGNEWNRKNFVHFKNYVESGGILDIYLPNINEINSRFYKKTSMSKASSDKIYRTISLFQSISNKNIENINIHVLNKGFHYMFARIEKKNNYIFLFSPYPNNYNKSESPVILFNENYVNHDMKNFIENEIEYLTDSTSFPNLELEKFIIWKVKRNRVFISTELFCPAGCTFCYVNSLIANKQRAGSVKLAKMICEVIRNDERFIPGVNGTTIMLGSFSDPFYKKNIEASFVIIDFFAIHKNFIHISTRFPISSYQNIFSPDSNVVINFSISSLRNDIEVNNQYDRFQDAKILISKGYKVALFLRPVIQDVTIKDIHSIIELSKESGIQEITIGSLYVDERILNKLSSLDIDISNIDKINKEFVLDDNKILEKLKIKDLDIIHNQLQDEGFNVFISSDQRIEYYKK